VEKRVVRTWSSATVVESVKVPLYDDDQSSSTRRLRRSRLRAGDRLVGISRLAVRREPRALPGRRGGGLVLGEGLMVGGLVPGFGAKRKLAPRIVELFPTHEAFLDAFCFSLAVTFAKPPSRMEVVNDLNGAVVNLARVVQSPPLAEALFARGARTFFCEALYEDSLKWLNEFAPPDRMAFTPNLEWAHHYLVASWQGRNGLVGTTAERTSGFCKRFTAGGGDPAVRFRSVIDSIPDWCLRLRGVTILNEDAFGVLARFQDTARTVVYLDPPYYQKSGQYIWDFADPDNREDKRPSHERLADLAARFRKAAVFVSYYEHPELDALYLGRGFHKVELTTTKHMAPGAKKTAPEVLYVSNA
jgi:DNA adenine methylase